MLFFCVAVSVGFAVVLALVLVCAGLNFRTPAATDISHSAFLVTPPAPLLRPVTIRVATFNIFDLPPFGSHRAERMHAIGRRLAELAPDLIGFQEAFYPGDRSILLTELAQSGLVHSRYFRSGFVGSGLLIVSRFAIVEAHFRRYSRWGKPHKVWHGDWWAGKGVGLVRVRLPDATGYLDFFDTHAHADYGRNEYPDVILSNLQECATFINTAGTRTSPTLAVGDYNARLDSPPGRALVTGADLIRLMTADSAIDHIFARTNAGYACEVLGTTAIQGTVHVGDKEVRLSDHSGYVSTIRITPKPACPGA